MKRERSPEVGGTAATPLPTSSGIHDDEESRAPQLQRQLDTCETAKEARFEGRHMPTQFHNLLHAGEDHYEVPDEAPEVEDLVKGYQDFTDLSPERREALRQSVLQLCDECAKRQASSLGGDGPVMMSRAQFERLRVKASRLRGFADTARKSELIASYRELVNNGQVQPSETVEQLLVRKRGKSHSGVLVITTLMGPSEFSCPKDCHYCPQQPGVARSYLLKEPAVLRGFRNGWDPIAQFYDRASALEGNGHVVDKIELIILGGTFSFYPPDYVEAYIAGSFYAANTYGCSGGSIRPMRDLESEITENETAACRIIGLTIETRPDYINAKELRRLRRLGVTRVQLGVQHLDDDILTIINRDCPTWKAAQAIQRLLDAGFKVDAHWMPDLPGSSYEKDLEMFQFLLNDSENTAFQVDQWKVYPTATVPYTRISEWYREGRYKPYAELDGGAWMVKLLVFILSHAPYRLRLNRIVRDIPTTYIHGGEKRVNLRQLIDEEMKREGTRCVDIRERECKMSSVQESDVHLFTASHRASGGTEYYLSVENHDRTQLYGHLRLRIRDDSETDSILPVLNGAALIRELHTYGSLVAVNAESKGATATQHKGVGTRLMQAAEAIAYEQHHLSKIAVIAGIGARGYYAKLGYTLEDTYMVKSKEQSTSAEDEEKTAQPQQQQQQQQPQDVGKPSFFSKVKRFLHL